MYSASSQVSAHSNCVLRPWLVSTVQRNGLTDVQQGTATLKKYNGNVVKDVWEFSKKCYHKFEVRNTSPSMYLKYAHLYRKAPTCTVDRFQSELSVMLGLHGWLKSTCVLCMLVHATRLYKAVDSPMFWQSDILVNFSNLCIFSTFWNTSSLFFLSPLSISW